MLIISPFILSRFLAIIYNEKAFRANSDLSPISGNSSRSWVISLSNLGSKRTLICFDLFAMVYSIRGTAGGESSRCKRHRLS